MLAVWYKCLSDDAELDGNVLFTLDTELETPLFVEIATDIGAVDGADAVMHRSVWFCVFVPRLRPVLFFKPLPNH